MRWIGYKNFRTKYCFTRCTYHFALRDNLRVLNYSSFEVQTDNSDGRFVTLCSKFMQRNLKAWFSIQITEKHEASGHQELSGSSSPNYRSNFSELAMKPQQTKKFLSTSKWQTDIYFGWPCMKRLSHKLDLSSVYRNCYMVTTRNYKRHWYMLLLYIERKNTKRKNNSYSLDTKTRYSLKKMNMWKEIKFSRTQL